TTASVVVHNPFRRPQPLPSTFHSRFQRQNIFVPSTALVDLSLRALSSFPRGEDVTVCLLPFLALSFRLIILASRRAPSKSLPLSIAPVYASPRTRTDA